MLFFSVDWGTTNCRIKLVNANQEAVVVLGATHTSMGISEVYNGWREQPDADRAVYYLQRLQPYLEKVVSDAAIPEVSLRDTPIVISGMASSSIGIEEIAYNKAPFELNPPSMNLTTVEAFGNPRVILLSGLRTEDNIMRGEETQLIGCWQPEFASEKSIFIFPGTHSKHIHVENASVSDFKTFVTGELLSLLTKYGTIKTTVSARSTTSWDTEGFRQGLMASKGADLLEHIFDVRCNGILSRLNKTQNYGFLVGLLLGHELRYLSHRDHIVLCASTQLMPFYTKALELLELAPYTTYIAPDIVDNSATIGQYKILQNSEHNKKSP